MARFRLAQFVKRKAVEEGSSHVAILADAESVGRLADSPIAPHKEGHP